MEIPYGKYQLIHGLEMYYEIHGSGFPLVLLHGGGSTIETTFGRILPILAKKNMIIAIELQAHGHTKDIDRPLSFEQDADDVASLLKVLNIHSSNFLGFSNGATTCLQIAIRHTEIVNRMVLIAAVYKRSGLIPGFWDGLRNAGIDDMPLPLKEAYLEINPDINGLAAMFHRDKTRMLNFTDISETFIQSISAPTLVINGNKDVVLSEHAMEISKNLRNSQFIILPGTHGQYIGEICTIPTKSNMHQITAELIQEFLFEKL